MTITSVTPKETSDEKLQQRAFDIRKLYQDNKRGDTLSTLIMGLFGTGKTRLLASGVRPLLVDSFDPNGTLILEMLYPEEIKNGDILIRTWWNEKSQQPTEYNAWERQWERDIRDNFLSRFGTYAIDSTSTFIDAMSNQVSKAKGRSDGALAIQDYKIIYNNIKDIVKLTSNQNVNFVMTGHLVDVKDEITGKVSTELAVYKSLKADLPLLFTEKYVLVNKPGSKGIERVLLTEDWKTYRASTQMGANNKFKAQEEPNLLNLLKKAGLPTASKPSLFKKV